MSEDRDEDKRVPLPDSLDSAQAGEDDPSRLAEDESGLADVDFESEDVLGGIGALQAKLRKLRTELDAAKKERQEYLDGWQRCKADSINSRREALQAAGRTSLRARESLIEELLPVLDSFESAMAEDGWQGVDASWRSGVEGIHAQLIAALETADARPFCKPGDQFDVFLHEPLQEISGAGKSGTVARVIRRGWRSGERILRPAQVVLFA